MRYLIIILLFTSCESVFFGNKIKEGTRQAEFYYNGKINMDGVYLKSSGIPFLREELVFENDSIELLTKGMSPYSFGIKSKYRIIGDSLIMYNSGDFSLAASINGMKREYTFDKALKLQDSSDAKFMIKKFKDRFELISNDLKIVIK